MITSKEWIQITTAIAHATIGQYQTGGAIVDLKAVYDILQTFAEPGCSATVHPDGKVTFTRPRADDYL